MATEAEVREALKGVMDPELGRSLVDLNMIRAVHLDQGCVAVTVALTTLACPLTEQIANNVRTVVGALPGVDEVEVELAEMTAGEKRQIGLGVPQKGAVEDMNVIRHVLAVMSGKGAWASRW